MVVLDLSYSCPLQNTLHLPRNIKTSEISSHKIEWCDANGVLERKKALTGLSLGVWKVFGGVFAMAIKKKKEKVCTANLNYTEKGLTAAKPRLMLYTCATMTLQICLRQQHWAPNTVSQKMHFWIQHLLCTSTEWTRILDLQDETQTSMMDHKGPKS